MDKMGDLYRHPDSWVGRLLAVHVRKMSVGYDDIEARTSMEDGQRIQDG